MKRKTFIKSACNFCLLGAAGMALPRLLGCSAVTAAYKTDIANNQIELPVSLFDKSTLQLVRPKGWYYDIAVLKNQANEYTALLLKCTHQDNQLTASGNSYQCSQFDKTGKVKKGPAERALKMYGTVLKDNSIIITI
jgi:Rieske Fe-S protein